MRAIGLGGKGTLQKRRGRTREAEVPRPPKMSRVSGPSVSDPQMREPLAKSPRPAKARYAPGSRARW